AQWPQASAGLSADRTRALRGEGSTSHSYSLTGSLGWEVDLWNRLGSATDAAELETLATAEDHAATRLALIGTVAELYWQLAYLNERLVASAASIDYARQTLALVQTQYDAGQSSALELAEARQSLETQLAADVALRQEQVEQRNALAVLYDGQSPVFDEPGRLLDAALPPVAADLPASLLGRRPDLRASELRLRASLKNVDATRASYYPDLSLTGTLGYSSAALGNLLQNPVGALGAGLTLPFLQWNQMQLQVDTARTDYAIAANDFRQGLYEALAEVENSLAGRRHFAEQEANRQRALDAAREAERIYRVRYESGAESLQSWITAQQTRRNAEITLAENRLNQLLNHISLAQALGGGAEQPADAEALLSDER
ncbi:efflux transporter outer membrane subunit, partial [Stutzerimonas nitrititolerans]|uniref:efflux transporter outer membrane subunit n=1 Tax=Stutzerimonas nitrititolerans TaxID=2482751 RepID=UPI00289C481B